MRHFSGLIPMRDGVELTFDCWLPDEDGAVPALVTRTPYGRGRFGVEPWSRVVETGYAHVTVDVRGRGDSPGTFVPWVHDGYDGYDVVEWVAAQDWCTGAVAGVGGSYDAITQYWAARHHPPSMRCMIPMAVSPQSEPTGTIAFSNGVPTPYWIWWFAFLQADSQKGVVQLDWDAILSVPPSEMAIKAGVYPEPWDDYIQGRIGYGEPGWIVEPEDIAIPTLVMNGLWDDPKTFEWWERFSGPQRRLLAGAWDHPGNAAPRPILGGVDVSGGILDPVPIWLEFLDEHLKGIAPQQTPPTVKIARSGSWTWEAHDVWPCAHTMHQHDLGTATWQHDPQEPLRLGGGSDLSSADAPLAASELDQRDDVVSFDLPTATADEDYSGQPVVTLTVEQEHPGSVAAWISDIASDGTGIRMGIWPTPHWHDGSGAQTVEIPLPHMHHRLKAGHHFRVSVASSFAPVYAHGLTKEQVTLTGGSIALPHERPH